MKKALIIPATFELGGRTWHVRDVAQPELTEEYGFGLEIYDEAEIRICRKHLGTPISRERREYAFVHELVHAALDEAAYKELSNDEAFVNRMAHALHQVLSSSAGNLR